MARKEAGTDTKAEAAMEEVEVTLPATRADSAVAPVGTMHLNMDLSEIPLPRLQLAYGVGRLSEFFNPGDLILGDDNKIASKGEVVEVTLLSLNQFWKEYLSSEMFAAGEMPRIFATKEEVTEAGGTTEFAGDQKPSFARAVELRMLVKKPDDLECGIFGLDLPDGGVYAPAIFTLDKTAYRKAGPGLITSATMGLQGNLLAGRFAISTRSEKVGQNMTVVPTIKLLPERNSEDVQEYIRNMFTQRA